MTSRLSLRFDPNQDYQRDAVSSVADLFDGLSRHEVHDDMLRQEIVANLPPFQALSESWLLDNLRATQERNGLPRGAPERAT